MNNTPLWLRVVRSEVADTSGTHGRGEREWREEEKATGMLGAPRLETYPFRYEHGRLRMATPVTLEIPMMAYLVTAAGKRRRRAKVVLGVLLAALAAVVAFT